MKLREKREDTFLEARLNFDGSWQDVLIRNVSAHGVMIQCRAPPPRGSYVEIRRGRYAIVGHVRWNAEHRCGTRSQDVIDLAQLTDDAHCRKPPGPERRHASRPRQASLAKLRQSRSTGRFLEFGFLAAGAATVAIFIGTSVADIFSEPVVTISKAMHVSKQHP